MAFVAYERHRPYGRIVDGRSNNPVLLCFGAFHRQPSLRSTPQHRGISGMMNAPFGVMAVTPSCVELRRGGKPLIRKRSSAPQLRTSAAATAIGTADAWVFNLDHLPAYQERCGPRRSHDGCIRSDNGASRTSFLLHQHCDAPFSGRRSAHGIIHRLHSLLAFALRLPPALAQLCASAGCSGVASNWPRDGLLLVPIRRAPIVGHEPGRGFARSPAVHWRWLLVACARWATDLLSCREDRRYIALARRAPWVIGGSARDTSVPASIVALQPRTFQSVTGDEGPGKTNVSPRITLIARGRGRGGTRTNDTPP